MKDIQYKTDLIASSIFIITALYSVFIGKENSASVILAAIAVLLLQAREIKIKLDEIKESK